MFPGEALQAVRDADICPSSDTVAEIEALRHQAPDQAALIGTDAGCALAMSMDTVRALGGEAASLHYLGAGPPVEIKVSMDVNGSHTEGFALGAYFTPATH